MKVLAPIDGSDCSFRALEFAIEFVTRYDGTLHVVHITDYTSDTTDQILTEAQAMLDEAGIENLPEIVTDTRMSKPRYANQVGKDTLQLADDNDYNHIVMGHHGTGRIGRAVLGSAARTVVRAAEHPATIVP
jgi:nucleotide-binding universal stress UspA family protein